MSKTVIYAPCLECGKNAKPVMGLPGRPDLAKQKFFLCECGAYCGSHRTTGRPFGRPAGEATRIARMRAHRVFDPLWREGFMDRKEAYRWLTEQLRISSMDCHFGIMDEKTATIAFRICSKELNRRRREAKPD